jgi:cell division protein FtsB
VIGRARLALLVALVAGIVITATEFPLGQLMHDRAGNAQASYQLSQLQAQNRALASEVSSLHQPGTVARIAHQEYGLVANGQQSIVVLPSPVTGHNRTASESGPLSSTGVPKSDLVPTDAIVSPGARGASKASRTAGFWDRVLKRLEFWNASP